MDSDHHHRRKRSSNHNRRKLLLPFLSFFAFLVFVSSDLSFPFRPVISVPSSSPSRSLLRRLGSREHSVRPPRLLVRDRVLFPDHVVLMVDSPLRRSHRLDCVYSGLTSADSSDEQRRSVGRRMGIRRDDLVLVEAALSVDGYGEQGSIVRCPLPVPNSSFSAAAELWWRGGRDHDHPRAVGVADATLHNWENMVYEAVMDGDTAVVFVKGLNLRPHRRSDPSPFTCHFGSDGEMTKAISAAQEVIRCPLPRSLREADPVETRDIRVMIGVSRRGQPVRKVIPSVARVGVSNGYGRESKTIRQRKNRLCACTMAWNQAHFLREWIVYHAWLGIERWFIYDNNSDDTTLEVIHELDARGYNITRHVWPWIKTQEAGFSHCSLRAREECKWVGFFDVDEYFYLPYPTRNHKTLGIPGHDSLKAMVANFSSSGKVAEIRTTCHSFGPSGLTSIPSKGVTVGYTCRMQRPERHKSIVRTDAIDLSLLNEVHHFRLQDGFRYVNVPESMALINHYKYQSWETFRSKFYRRVSTYVADWQENQNVGSKDRAPGLGTEPIEPPDWRLRFCEVWDTELRDFIVDNFANPSTGILPWETSPR